jgi:prevent-host-death family protein
VQIGGAWRSEAVSSHLCYNRYDVREITQRELRNDSGEIMRGLDQGESFVVTRNGTPVGELIPLRRRRFVSADVVMGAFAGAPRIDPTRFRADVDSLLDQDPTPRV